MSRTLRIDGFCYASKNLRNSANYLITQCSRICRKKKEGEIPESREKSILYRLNCAIAEYNSGRKGKKQLAYVDENSRFIADAYFLSWYLKPSAPYREMPYATCSQICFQTLCKAWKAFLPWHFRKSSSGTLSEAGNERMEGTS